MSGLENIISKLFNNHLLIIAILILILILYLTNTSKTQVLTTSMPQVQVKNEKFIDVKNNNKAQFTVYYTSWCGWSKKALAILNLPEMVDYFKNNSKCELVLIDCESENGQNICKVNKIEGFPTMKLIIGNTSINYNGERTPQAIKQFINSNVD